MAAVTDRTRLVFCCTPNPPTGGLMTAAALEAVAAGIPDRVMLAVDEAYYEFGHHAGGPDALAILGKRRGPWTVLRTFSKAYGLAGARIGYAFCSDEHVAEAMRHAKLHYGASVPAQAGALAAYLDEAYLAQTLDGVARERRRLSDGLDALGLKTFASAANFVAVRMPIPAADAILALEKKGIMVRGWRDADYQNELRITVGLADDTDAVLAAVAEIVGKAGR
jgi:histidinol-phosphate aminotransferase